MEMDTNISGAIQEIEILEFKAGGNSYGVDINDIREILPYNTKPLPIPNANPNIEGIIKPRDFLIPIVNLIKILQLSDCDEEKNEMLIVSSINNLNIAFHIDSVKGIHRISTTDIAKPGKKVSTKFKNAVTGLLSRDDRNIEIIELRKLISEINPQVIVG
jgi:two-component system chemotaxis response regulator CheV